MGGLHLDHSYEVHLICIMWRRCIRKLGRPLRRWDDGINGERICQLLFSVEGPSANLHFRCGNSGRTRDVYFFANRKSDFLPQLTAWTLSAYISTERY